MSNRSLNSEIAFNAKKYTDAREYWIDNLSGQLTRSHFPYDFILANPDQRQSGAPDEKIEFEIPGAIVEKLLWIANDSDLRLFMVLLTGMVMALNKYTGQHDIIVGAPIEKQEQEGNFLNTILALRTGFAPWMTTKELLLQVRQTVVAAIGNQDFPLEKIPYELDMELHEKDFFALFETAVLLENLHDKNYINHLSLSMIFSFLRGPDFITGSVEYTSSLYRQDTLQRIIRHFIHLLHQAFFYMDRPVAHLDSMTDEEKEFLLYKMNDTGGDYPRVTVHELVEEQAEKNPGNIAVEEADTGRLISYKELNRQANQLAALLIEKGLKPGMAAAVMGERTCEIIIAVLAILKTGGVFLPLDAQDPDKRIHFILQDCCVQFFLSQKRIIEERPEVFRGVLPGHVIVMDDEHIYKGNAVNPAVKLGPQHLAYIIYTSGTTGNPKGVLVEHRSLVNYICFSKTNYVKGEPVNFPLYTSIAFDLTITSIFTPLVTGNAIVVYGGWDKGNLVERMLEDNKVGIIKLTPSHLSLIRDNRKGKDSWRVKRLIVGGENLENQLAQDVSDNFNGNIEIFNEYGPTETTVGCMLYKFNPGENNNRLSVPIGVPAVNTHIYLLDKNLKPVPPGASGEIYIAGTGLARGYLNRPELTAHRFIRKNFCGNAGSREGKLYKTGDLARWLPEGNIEFLGRIDRQVKIRGFRIELGEIQRQLMNHPGITDAVVIDKVASGGDSQHREKFLCAYFTADEELSVPLLKEYLSEKLPEYMVPWFFIRLEAIPLTSNGKVDRKALPEPQLQIEEEYIAPGNQTEVKLMEIWSEVLGVEKNIIGINSNFFEMGGHSLKGTILVSRIPKEFNVNVSLSDLFRLPTVALLSEYLKTAAEKKFNPISVTEEKEYYPVSSAQKRLYIMHHRHEDNIGYNIPAALELEGKLDKERVEKTFRQLIERHENFRTTFELVNDETVQRIYKEVDFRIEYFETPVEEDIEKIVEKIVRDFTRPFFLNQVPLLRAGLIKMNENRRILMFDMHHIIADGISMNVFIKEYMAAYAGEHLPALQLQYKDYSQWQNSQPEKESLKNQEEYWLSQFKSDIPVLNLPTDFVRPEEQSLAGSSVNFKMGIERTRLLKKLVFDTGVTLYIMMLTIYNLLLAKISGQDDIIVGGPIAGRKHADLQQIIGVFVNILAFRNYPHENKTFLEFLEEVKANALNAFENQEYQFEALVDKLGVKRRTGRNPLFDVVFVLENLEDQGGDIRVLEIPGLTLKPYGKGSKVAKYDLLFYLYERDNMHMRFEYCTKLFKQETIDVLVGYLMKIIDAVLENPRVELSEIDISSGDRNQEVQYQFFQDLEDE